MLNLVLVVVLALESKGLYGHGWLHWSYLYSHTYQEIISSYLFLFVKCELIMSKHVGKFCQCCLNGHVIP